MSSEQENPPPPPPPPSSGKGEKKKWSVSEGTQDGASAAANVAQNRVPSTTSWVGIGSNTFEKSSTGFVGLSNQGATCYLNSLIQTLYMTPEVRRILYKWQYDAGKHGKENFCIPLQLQKLFGRLQLSQERAVSTEPLTESFRWTKQDSFIQHDVQELCRVLFEALDKTLTPQLYLERHAKAKADLQATLTPAMVAQLPEINQISWSEDKQDYLVSDLYSGKMLDYMYAKGQFRSDGSQVGRERLDTFMDVQLVIRDIGSVEEALENYVKPETLSGDNQWRCEELNAAVDADKGFKFKTLPYLLTLHLKRFDYDMITFQRVKLSNRVTFPFELDMTKYVTKNDNGTPIEYELFSVLIHSGNARGGHYFAYIKNFADKKWYNFNDSNITEITEDDVKQMYGNDDDAKTKSYGVSTNAYMLMYRLKDPAHNITNVPNSEVPAFIHDEIKQINDEFEKERKEWEERKRKIQLRIFYDKQPVLPLVVDKDDTIASIKKRAYEELSKLEIWKGHAFEDCRLREGSWTSPKLGKNYDGMDDLTAEQCKFTQMKAIVLECKNPNEPWQVEKNQVSIYVSRYSAQFNDFDTPTNIKVDADLTLAGLKKAFETAYGPAFPADRLCVINCTGGNMFLYEKDYEDKIIEKDLGIHDHSLLYIEALSDPDAPSLALKRLIEQQNSFEIYFNIPGEETSSQSISFDKTKTIKELKQAIAAKINKSPDSFIMSERRLRGPFKNDSQTLTEAMLYDCAQVYLEEGTPIKETEHYIKLYLYIPFDEQSAAELLEDEVEKPLDWSTPYKRKPAMVVESIYIPSPKTPDSNDYFQTDTYFREDDTVDVVKESSVEDNTAAPSQDAADAEPFASAPTIIDTATTTSTAQTEEESTNNLILALMRRKKEFKLLGKVALDENTKLIDFKQKIATYLGLPSANHVRLRTKMGTMFINLMTQDDATMKENYPSLSDGKQFVIQMLKEPEYLTKGDSLINVQRWYPSQWKLGKKVEVVVNEQTRFKSTEALKQAIAKVYDTPVDIEHMSLTKPPGSFEFWTQKECADVVLFTWDLEADNMFAKPFGLRDGDYILFKDSREAEKIAIDELKTMINKEQPTVVYNARAQAREQQLRIYTSFDEMPEEKKEAEKKAEESSKQ